MVFSPTRNCQESTFKKLLRMWFLEAGSKHPFISEQQRALEASNQRSKNGTFSHHFTIIILVLGRWPKHSPFFQNAARLGSSVPQSLKPRAPDEHKRGGDLMRSGFLNCCCFPAGEESNCAVSVPPFGCDSGPAWTLWRCFGIPELASEVNGCSVMLWHLPCSIFIASQVVKPEPYPNR